MCDLVTCEVRVCGLRCRSGSSLYIYRVYLLSYALQTPCRPRRPTTLPTAPRSRFTDTRIPTVHLASRTWL